MSQRSIDEYIADLGGGSGYLTEEDVRAAVMDRAAQQNVLDLGVEFATQDIASAMVRCAREYNGIEPRVETVNPGRLPTDSNLFLAGVLKHLYITKLIEEQQKDVN